MQSINCNCTVSSWLGRDSGKDLLLGARNSSLVSPSVDVSAMPNLKLHVDHSGVYERPHNTVQSSGCPTGQI